MEKLKPYIIEIEIDKIMKAKEYPLDCVVKRDNWRFVIIITYDKYTFFYK